MLLADEPTSALDILTRQQVIREMLRLRELFGTAIVIVTHDIGVAAAMADTVLVLREGRTVEYGPAGRILSAPPASLYQTSCWRQCRGCGGAEPWKRFYRYRI